MYNLKLYITMHCQSNVLDLAAGAFVGKTCWPRNTRREPASHLCDQPMWLRDFFVTKQRITKITKLEMVPYCIVVLLGNEEAQNGCSLWMKRFCLFLLVFSHWTKQQIARIKIAITVNNKNGVQCKCLKNVMRHGEIAKWTECKLRFELLTKADKCVCKHELLYSRLR